MTRLATYMLVVIVASMFLAGCSPEIERPSLEDMAFIGVIGFDYINKKDVKVSVSSKNKLRQKESVAR